MRKVIRKWFWVWQFDKEEKWLNEMAARGLALSSVGFARYEFEETEPGEYTCRLELLAQYPNHPESEQYIRFLEETGVEQVGSYMRWVYFRKRRALGEFDLYSDNASRLHHLRRIMMLLLPLLIFNAYIGCYNLFLYMQNHFAVSLVCALLSLTIAILLGIGMLLLARKRKRLQTEAQLFE